MYGSIMSCASLHSYSQAKRHFENRGPVRSHRWAMEERPLSGTREQWYRVVQGGMDDYFDMVLYQTPMVRYYKPDDDGSHTVLLCGDNHTLSWQFLDNAGWPTWRRGIETARGVRVIIPLNTNVRQPHGIVPEGWSAKLRFNSDGCLIFGESDHRPVFVPRASAEDRERRKAAKEILAPIIDAMMFLIPQLHENSVVNRSMARAFGGMENKWAAHRAGTLINKTIRGGGELPEELAEHLQPYAQELYNVALSKHVEAEGGEEAERTRQYRGDLPGKEFPHLSEERFRTALLASMIREAGLNTARKMVPLPKFQTQQLPRNFTSHGDQ